MKRKKWTEAEEQTLLAALLSTTTTPTGTTTRQQKYQPIADHINSLHHHPNPSLFPHLRSWRDVSIKLQNMHFPITQHNNNNNKEEDSTGVERKRRREEKREEEEMEWMERVLCMQMDHEKRAMHMHADASQTQLQMIGVLVRLLVGTPSQESLERREEDGTAAGGEGKSHCGYL